MFSLLRCNTLLRTYTVVGVVDMVDISHVLPLILLMVDCNCFVLLLFEVLV